MVKVYLIMQMAKFIMEIFVKIKKKDKDVFILMKILNIQETLKMVKWMEKVYTMKKTKKFKEYGKMENLYKNLVKIKFKIILVIIALVKLIQKKKFKIQKDKINYYKLINQQN